jgi:hypothetical protein
MTRHSYRERDYTFRQAMFKLHTSIGLTQAGLTDLLWVSSRDKLGQKAQERVLKLLRVTH